MNNFDSSMNIPNTFGIDAITGCNLSCNFCEIKYLKKRLMKFEIFKKIIKWLKKCDIKEIDLTPLAGEFVLHPEWEKMLEISLLSFNKVILFTNGLFFKYDKKFFKYKNLYLYMSVYKNSYIMKYNSYFNKYKKLTLIVRNNDIDLNLIKNKNIKFEIKKENRINLKPITSEPSLCKFMLEPIITEKGLKLCCFHSDIKPIIKLEKLLQMSKKDLQLFYNNIINEIKNKNVFCNTSCGWYIPYNSKD